MCIVPSMKKVPTFLLPLFSRKGGDDAEASGCASSSTQCVESTGPETRGNGPSFGSQTHPQPVASDTLGDMKLSPLQPTGILKSGISCIHKRHAPSLGQESEFLARWDLDASHELITQRSWELTRNHTRLPPRRLAPTTNLSTVPDQRSSSTNQSEAPSSNRAEAQDRKVRTDAIEDSNLQLSTNRPDEAIVDSPVGPPPPCPHCNNDQHSGYCKLLRRFSSNELIEVTDGYSADNKFNYQHELLFRGNLDGQRVYVVRREQHEQLKFLSEVNILGSVRHPNIAFLLGYCDEENHLALVFDFACNGTLSFHLDAKNLNTSMQWPNRANLAIQLGKTLVYLHDKNIIHGNVNSMFVFLHRNWTPLIARFDLARNVGAGHDVILYDRSGEPKSRGYLAPEYEPGGKVSMQQDIYAFGVVLFELISGRPAFDRRNKTNKFLGEWGRATVEGFQETDQGNLLMTMADRRLNVSEINMCDILRMIKVAALCTKNDPKERPLMAQIVEMLTGDIEQSQAPENPVVPDREDEKAHDTDVPQTGSLVKETLTEETEIQQSQIPERMQDPDRRVRWADDDPETGRTVISSDDDQTLKKSLPLSEMAAKFLRDLKVTFKLNQNFQVPPRPKFRDSSSNSVRYQFNYYQGKNRRPMKPPPSPAKNYRRPSTPGHRLNRIHIRGQYGDSVTGNSGDRIPTMSPVRVNVIIRPMSPVIFRYYERRSWPGSNSVKTHGKRVKFEKQRTWMNRLV